MRRKLVACFLLVVAAGAFLFVGCGKKEKNKNVVVAAMAAEWPPMEMVDENKDIVGFDVDLIKAIGKEEGFEVKLMNSSWDGLFAGIASNEYDVIISSVTITEDRKKTMDFSTPYLNAGQILIVPETAKGVTKLSDFNGKTVGAQIGTTGAFEIDKHKNIKKRTYDEVGLAVADLANGRIDAVVTDTPIAANYVLQKDEYKGKLKIAGKPFTKEEFGIVVKKGNKEMLDRINRGLKKVVESGKLEQIKKKWLH